MTKIRYFHKCDQCGEVNVIDRTLEEVEEMSDVPIIHSGCGGIMSIEARLPISLIKKPLQDLSFIMGSFTCGDIHCLYCPFVLNDGDCLHDFVNKVQEKL